jgi:hypothetical protein
MESSYINDGRQSFKNITFSKFQKSKARLELIKNLYDEKIENACYWSAEFICAGHFLDLWDVILYYSYKYIHNGNPKLTLYLNMRYSNFVAILNNGYSDNIIKLRNNDKIRKLFCELICVLCYSHKKNVICDVNLDKNNSFELSSMSEKFKAPNVTYTEVVLKHDDPKELIIPINEMVYNLISKNIIQVCYWYEWLIEYENICTKKKRKCICETRAFAPHGHTHDLIWIVWDILFYYSDPSITDKKYNISNTSTSTSISTSTSNTSTSILKHKIIKNLFDLFIIKYNNSVKKKRRYIIYFAFTLLIEELNYSINIIENQEAVQVIVSKINSVYKDIKKNEETPNTDYLFNNLNKSNLEKSIEKMDLFNELC